MDFISLMITLIALLNLITYSLLFANLYLGVRIWEIFALKYLMLDQIY